MKLASITIAALLLALTGPASAQNACMIGYTIGTDGDCEEEPKVTVSLVQLVPDADNPGQVVEVVTQPMEIQPTDLADGPIQVN